MNARMSYSPLKRFSNKSSLKLLTAQTKLSVGNVRRYQCKNKGRIFMSKPLMNHLRMFKGPVDIMSSRDLRASNSLALLRAIQLVLFNRLFNIC